MYRKQRGRAAGAQQEGRLDDAARGHRDADRRLARPRQQVSAADRGEVGLRQRDRHPDPASGRAHQDPPLRPRPPLPRGERLLGHQDREGCLLRENHAEVWPEIDIRSCRYDHQ